MFGIATGWLGWPPSEAWESTAYEVKTALDARLEWERMKNPSPDGGKAPPKEKPQDIGEFIRRIQAQPDTKVHHGKTE